MFGFNTLISLAVAAATSIVTVVPPTPPPYYPTVLIHGIGSNTNQLAELEDALTTRGVKTYNIEIGNGDIDSIFWNMNKQCETFRRRIETLVGPPQNKINIIGISQGGLLARCYVERYAHVANPVHSLITYGTPHMGIYLTWTKLLSLLGYWKDPYRYGEYLATNDFLVYLNSEKPHAEATRYRENLVTLANFMVVWSKVDTVVAPVESTRFEFYNITQAKEERALSIVALRDSAIYTEDYIGLKALDSTERLIVAQYDCNHDEFKLAKCFMKNFSERAPRTLLDHTLELL